MNATGAAAFPDEDWCARARAATAGLLEVSEGLNGRIQYHGRSAAGDRRWLQVIVDGQIERWEPGDVADPDVTIHWALEDAREILSRRLAGTKAMTVTRISTTMANGPYDGPPP